jgi:hypothetical protein
VACVFGVAFLGSSSGEAVQQLCRQHWNTRPDRRPKNTPNSKLRRRQVTTTGDDDRRPQAHVHQAPPLRCALVATSRITLYYGYVPSGFCNLYFPSRRARLLPHFALCLRAMPGGLFG